MKNIWKILLTIFLILSGGWIIQRYQENKKKRKEEEEAIRKKLFANCQPILTDIHRARDEIVQKHLSKIKYFTNSDKTLWINNYKNQYSFTTQNDFEKIGLETLEVELIRTFRFYYANIEQARKKYNKEYIDEELENYKSFFDNIEGKKLDNQQRTAIVTDEDNNLIIAGAGSGKTTTIVGKVNYILKKYNISPSEILLISFTNKSAKTLADRIKIDGVVAKTFHKFGKDIIVEAEQKQPSIFDEAQFKPLIKRYFNEFSKDNTYLSKVTGYFIDYLKPPLSPFAFKNQGEYIQYMKDNNFRSYKSIGININGKLTYKMEVVKSIEECKIANFLLFNGVKYEYEYPFEHDTANENFRQYKPDFTIIQNGKKIYIEHFGISREGKVPDWFSGDDNRTPTEKYTEEMEWKRQTHIEHETVLIETYSYEMQEGILFENLENKLQSVGIELHPLTPNQIWEIIKDASKEEVNNFVTIFATFITLLKSNNYSIADVIEKNKATNDDFFKSRNQVFIDIVQPIFEKYQSKLKERNEIDFSDMINKASEYVANGSSGQNFQYIIIDEFQDISIGRYKLIKAIKSINPQCKLFCVGDDWQSIYRFSGSDISLFKDFEKYFGFTERLKIETTYRFHEPLIKLSSDFILKNPNQVPKELSGTDSEKLTQYRIVYTDNEDQDDTESIQKILDDLILNYEDIDDKKILILGRYGFDIDRIKNEKNTFTINSDDELISYNYKGENDSKNTIVAQFLTVHKSKGLEADIVVIINCNSGKYGFPSEMSDDQVLNLLLSEADQFENGEERRLFYVAITRAKEKVYLVTDSIYKSKFIAELEVESDQVEGRKCPICKTADVVLRKTGTSKNGDDYKFYGCSNYLYGCNHTNTEWANDD